MLALDGADGPQRTPRHPGDGAETGTELHLHILRGHRISPTVPDLNHDTSQVQKTKPCMCPGDGEHPTWRFLPRVALSPSSRGPGLGDIFDGLDSVSLASRGQGWPQTSYKAQDGFPQQRIIQPIG